MLNLGALSQVRPMLQEFVVSWFQVHPFQISCSKLLVDLLKLDKVREGSEFLFTFNLPLHLLKERMGERIKLFDYFNCEWALAIMSQLLSI